MHVWPFNCVPQGKLNLVQFLNSLSMLHVSHMCRLLGKVATAIDRLGQGLNRMGAALEGLQQQLLPVVDRLGEHMQQFVQPFKQWLSHRHAQEHKVSVLV